MDDAPGAVDPTFIEAARDSASAGLAVAEQSGSSAPVLAELVQQALVDGFSSAMVVSTVLLLIAAAVVAVRTPKAAEAAAQDVLDHP